MQIAKRIISLRKLLMIFVDIIITGLALPLALWTRFDMAIPAEFKDLFFKSWYFIIICAFAVFYMAGFYNQIWRYASIHQYAILGIGTLAHTLIVSSVMVLIGKRFPISVYMIYWMMIFLALTCYRIAYRVLIVLSNNRRTNGKTILHHNQQDRLVKRVMIVGAGQAGSQIIRELQLYSPHRQPVAVIDDNPMTHTYLIMGVPVVGDRSMISQSAKTYKIDEIILAIPSASRQSVREIVELCNQTGCELKSIPHLSDLINGKVSIAEIKDVDIEDLLGREEIHLDTEEITQYLHDEIILVSGGGGSIGSEICRQIARYQPRQLIIFDIYENNAYNLQIELQGIYGDKLDLQVLIGSVRDEQRLMEVCELYHPGVVFHAAAHKHVPLMEDSPGEAVKNNIFGTLNMAKVAANCGVKRFVLISTDKAVNPTNVMGATKRVTELIIQSLCQQYPQTKFAAVRFGNVLGSSGSVIPLFKQQIKQERRITVTHPDITRYFMTIPEAAQLVIQAGAMAKDGEIFVLDMGKPVKIIDLAKDLIRLSGFEPDVDVKIDFTGLRPGEKMYEELYQDMEGMNNTRHKKIFVLKPVQDICQLNQEIDHLCQVIRCKSPEFRQLIDWIKLRMDPVAQQ